LKRERRKGGHEELVVNGLVLEREIDQIKYMMTSMGGSWHGVGMV